MEGDVGADGVVDDGALTSENGLSHRQRSRDANGLSTVNGLSITNGLATVNGLSTTNGLMTTAGGPQPGRVHRPLRPAGDRVDHQEGSVRQELHVPRACSAWRPQWQNGACDTNCQENVSACLLAHINTAGIHVPLWIVSSAPGGRLGPGSGVPEPGGELLRQRVRARRARHRPDQGADVLLHGREVQRQPARGPHRLDADEPALRQSVRQHHASCSGASRCAAADYPYQADGFKACNGWNNVVTVWRQNTIDDHDDQPSGGSGPRLPLEVARPALAGASLARCAAASASLRACRRCRCTRSMRSPIARSRVIPPPSVRWRRRSPRR